MRALGYVLALTALALAGCSTQTAPLDKTEEKAFKGGGPMSEEAKREIAKRMGKVPPQASAGAATKQ